jgi:hypothetical protein
MFRVRHTALPAMLLVITSTAVCAAHLDSASAHTCTGANREADYTAMSTPLAREDKAYCAGNHTAGAAQFRLIQSGQCLQNPRWIDIQHCQISGQGCGTANDAQSAGPSCYGLDDTHQTGLRLALTLPVRAAHDGPLHHMLSAGAVLRQPLAIALHSAMSRTHKPAWHTPSADKCVPAGAYACSKY